MPALYDMEQGCEQTGGLGLATSRHLVSRVWASRWMHFHISNDKQRCTMRTRRAMSPLDVQGRLHQWKALLEEPDAGIQNLHTSSQCPLSACQILMMKQEGLDAVLLDLRSVG